MTKLTHFNTQGDAHMVDIADKAVTKRRAVASGHIRMQAETLAMISAGEHKKGDVLGIARIAGIMAAKKTADLIPLCHPIPITHIDIALDIDNEKHCVKCVATLETEGKTGIEMEALTAVQLTLLTIYDMCKAVDRGMSIEAVHLDAKSGGRSGDWQRNA